MVAALALFPYYGAKLVPVPTAAATATNLGLQTTELKISGMSCEACAAVVKAKLLEIPGVAQAEVHYPAGHALVKYDPAKADAAKLIEAVNSTGYTASLLNP
jgi:copper chaperone CopZ